MTNTKAEPLMVLEAPRPGDALSETSDVHLRARSQKESLRPSGPATRVPPEPKGEKPVGETVPAGGAAAPARKRIPRRALMAAVILGLTGIGGHYGYYWWTEGRFLVSTDDAYVKADLSVIAAKVGGYIVDVPIKENEAVAAGQLLAKVDDRDYRIAVQSAQNRLATQDATIARLKEQVRAQQAMVEQTKAQVASAQAGLVRANADFERAQALEKRDYGSRQSLDQARAQRDQGEAAVQAARAAQLAAEANVSVLNAQIEEAVHVRAELQSSLEKAELDLSYTQIRAPFAGVVGNKAVQLGQYVQPGTRLLALVPLDTVYVEANYKETQLADIRLGQTADVRVDAADGRQFHGIVESIAPASGSQFSLLPPENATGNFTKIVQRVPVRIRVSGEAVKAGVLRPGLSVVTYVHTKETAAAKGQGSHESVPDANGEKSASNR